MAAEGLRATVANSSEHFQLRPRQMGLVPVNEVVARCSKDIGHLKRCFNRATNRLQMTAREMQVTAMSASFRCPRRT